MTHQVMRYLTFTIAFRRYLKKSLNKKAVKPTPNKSTNVLESRFYTGNDQEANNEAITEAISQSYIFMNGTLFYRSSGGYILCLSIQ